MRIYVCIKVYQRIVDKRKKRFNAQPDANSMRWWTRGWDKRWRTEQAVLPP